jgi:tRNA wybutosine-synthesizing protein 3
MELPNAAKNPFAWVPDFEESISILPSFLDIRRKTLDLLYEGGGVDKSPKGSVDELIQPLVDLLNQHPSFTTLSSCSGRIALFDPGCQDQDVGSEEEVNNEDITDERSRKSGKGRGAWLLASHEIVPEDVLIKLLNSSESASASTMVLKHEPLLLHVAACNLDRGRQLLTLALGLGFRESGLVVTETRVTVAIRGYSLAMTMPLAREGSLRPPDDYLIALMQQANLRMRQNQDKLVQLYDKVRDSLFQKICAVPQEEVTHLQLSLAKIPPLNLWGHGAVAFNDDIYVFGGYGSGPFAFGQRCKRSSQVYRISKENGTFRREWRELEQIGLNDHERKQVLTTWYNVDVVLTNIAPCEGVQASVLPLHGDHKTVVAIWGGRTGPTKPLGELLIYEPETRTDCFSIPVDIKGDVPEPRWGHTLTALSGEYGYLAILIGGRTEHESLSSSYLLSLIEGERGKQHFQWTKIDLAIPPQFHHTVVWTPENAVIIFGGLTDPNDLLESFTDSYHAFGSLVHMNNLKGQKSVKKSSPVSAFQIESDGRCQIIPFKVGTNIIHHYGASGVVMEVDGKTAIGLTGGVPFNLSTMAFDSEPIRWFSLDRADDCLALSLLDVDYANDMDATDMDDINFSALVHHCCIGMADSKGDALLLGGGISSFAFGASFAR